MCSIAFSISPLFTKGKRRIIASFQVKSPLLKIGWTENGIILSTGQTEAVYAQPSGSASCSSISGKASALTRRQERCCP